MTFPAEPRASARPAGRRELGLVLLICLVVPAAALARGLWEIVSEYLVTDDFASFYSGALAASEGGSAAAQAYMAETFTARHAPWLGRDLPGMTWGYAPVVFLLVLPLALLPPLPAFFAWTAFNLAGFVVAGRAMGLSRLSSAAMMLFPVAVMNAVTGQNGGLSAALLALGLANLDRREWLAGFFIGLLSYKPQLGLLIPVALLAGGYWRAIFSAGVTVAGLAAASFLVLGAEPWVAFVDRSLPEYWRYVTSGLMHWERMATVYPFLRLLGLPHQAAFAIQLASLGLSAVAVWWAWRRKDRLIRIGSLTLGILLATPYGYHYDLAILSVPFALLFAAKPPSELSLTEAGGLAALWLLPLLHRALMGQAGLQVWPVLIALGMAVLLWRGIRRAERPLETA